MKLPSDTYDPLAFDHWTHDDRILLIEQCRMYLIFEPKMALASVDPQWPQGKRTDFETCFARLEEYADRGVVIAMKAMRVMLRDRFLEKSGFYSGSSGDAKQDAGAFLRHPRRRV